LLYYNEWIFRLRIFPYTWWTLVVGSILSSGGSGPKENPSASDWADMVDGFQQKACESRLGIPLIYGIDAVHGNNSIYGATIFPHNVGLGATRLVLDCVPGFLSGFLHNSHFLEKLKYTLGKEEISKFIDSYTHKRAKTASFIDSKFIHCIQITSFQQSWPHK
jgi:hypothetical protein